MQALAGFIMRGRSQAALVAAAAAVLSLIVPLAGIVSAGAVALVALRQGATEGLVVGLFASLASGLLAYLALGSPLPAIGFALALWLPVWVLAVVLRNTRSLDLAAQLAVLFGLLILVGVRLQAADPAAFWADLLEPVRETLVEGQVMGGPESLELMRAIGRWMTGAFAAIFYFQVILSLLLARWWQSLLYNPAGFGAEFRELRISRALGAVGLVLLVLLAAGVEAQWMADLLLLLTPLYFLQGVAVAHGLADIFKLSRGWLIGFYVVLVLAMPHAEILVAGLGLVDIWMNVRARAAARGGKRE